MNNKICTFLITFAVLASGTVFASASEPPLIVYGYSHFYQIKPDYSGFNEISKETYYKTALQDHPPIKGIDSVKVAFEQKDRDIFVDDIKVLTLPTDPGGIMDIRYEVYNLYKVQTPDLRTFYYIQSGLNMAMPNSYGETDDLVEVKNGKVLQSLQVYDYLQYINSNLWRSTECISGAGYYGLHQLSIGAKPVDVNLSEQVVRAAIRNKDTFVRDLSTGEIL